jgi:histidyl-tRNA synthetase
MKYLMKVSTSPAKGTRDFLPVEMNRRNYIFDTIKEVYQLHGFRQIVTPAMENLSTLLGKYGEEGDKLLFRILNSGDFLSKAKKQSIPNEDTSQLLPFVAEKGLRYDLTVPFARYVVQHRNELTFPFKRFQIQPVWRADRPQKGRYREFYQCDADIIGSNSLLNEIELVQVIDEVFTKLDISVSIKLNNRKILSGIAEIINRPEKIIDITVAIDKLEKIGFEKVKAELLEKGLTENEISTIEPIILLEGSNAEKLQKLEDILKKSETGQQGINELKEVFNLSDSLELKSDLELDLTLARGLDYYTGAIIEVVANDVKMGSICGGGRYDDLTGIFGLPDVSGVGISFGADRIYDVLNDLGKFDDKQPNNTKVLLVNFDSNLSKDLLRIASKLWKANIKSEIYPDPAKMKKQFAYADKINIPYVLVVGEDEIKSGKLQLKNMATGEQESLSINDIIFKLNESKSV